MRYVVRLPDGSERPPHLLLVSYVFPPADVSAVRRVVALRRAFDDLGIRTSVLTSAVSGRRPDDVEAGIVRAADLRTRLPTQYQVLVGQKDGPIVRTSPRWWTRLAVPDITAVSWGPGALREAIGIVKRDRPDAVFTTSPPESVHLVGLALRRLRVPWIADLRDGWTFEAPAPRPYARWLDRGLERLVVRSADRVTAVTEPLAEYLRYRYGADGRVVHLSNGFDPRALREASDERHMLDPSRFSLVYTGSGGMDGKDPRPFLSALARLLDERPEVASTLEVVFAGTFASDEIAAMNAPDLRGIVKFVGSLEHRRAVGLQQAADGLLLITSLAFAHVATGKLYEYLAARKPIFALASRNAATEILERAGGHVLAPPENPLAIFEPLRLFLDERNRARGRYSPARDFDLDQYAFPRVARRLLDSLAEISAIEPDDR